MATQASRIAGIFALFGATWILLSDALLFSLASVGPDLRSFGTAEGLVFVALSALLIWWLVRRFERREELRMEAEQRLRLGHRRVLDSLGEAVFVVKDRRIEDCNAAAEEMFGFEKSEMLGASTELLHLDWLHFDAFGRRSEPLLRQGKAFELETVMQRKDGTSFPTSHTVKLLNPSEGLDGGAVSVVRDETARAEAAWRRREFYNHLHQAREDERTHIAREIHDDLGQTLTGVIMDLSRLRSSLDDPESVGTIEEIADLVRQGVESVRSLASDLRPSVLEELGLVPALEWLAEKQENRFPEGCEFDTETEDADLPGDAGVHIYRIVQEALTNAVRHADASAARVRIRQDDGSLVVEVADDGSWRDPETASPTLGLTGMRERAQLVGGELRVDGSPEGTCVRLVVPLGNGSGP